MAQRPAFHLEAAVDVRAELIGQDVGALTGNEKYSGISVQSTLPPAPVAGASIAVLTTVSTLQAIQSQIENCLNAGYHVVTTCEELSYPWQRDAQASAAIDELARAKGLGVLGTGVNPGFMMDFLPQALTAICQRVDHIIVERFQDASTRRVPFQKKVGVGLTPTQFQAKKDDGSLKHVGLEESMHLIASQLGWKLDRTEDIIEPVLAETEYENGEVKIPAGDALGVMQTGRGFRDGKEVITLLFKAAAGLENPRDKIIIEGDPSFESVIPGGINGDNATCSILLNACRAISNARPGLRTMAEVAGISWFDRAGEKPAP